VPYSGAVAQFHGSVSGSGGRVVDVGLAGRTVERGDWTPWVIDGRQGLNIGDPVEASILSLDWKKRQVVISTRAMIICVTE